MFDNDSRYAETRMSGSFFLFNDQLKKVIEIIHSDGNRLDDSIIVCSNPRTGDVEKENIKNMKYYLGKLGYIDFNGTSQFISRLPLRRDWKQGLRENQLAIIAQKQNIGIPPDFIYFNYYAIQKCISGVYRKISQAFDDLEDTGLGQAISRSFLISNKYELIYRGLSKVGKINRDNGKIKLDDNYDWLSDELGFPENENI